MNQADVVIVGAGHNGLIAANYLAMAGMDVLVLEKQSACGGATQSQQLFSDYDANISRYAYLISLLHPKILSDLKIDLTILPRRIASFTAWQDHVGTQRGLLISNEDETVSRTSIEQLSTKRSQWKGYQRFQQLANEAAELFWPTLLEPLRPADDFKQSLDSPLAREAWQCFVEEPLGRAIESCVDDDALRGLLMTDGKIGVHTHPDDETLLQNRCFLYHVVGQGNGSWAVPQGGMGRLPKQLAELAQKRGAVIKLNHAVASIQVGDPMHTIHCLAGDEEVTYEAKHILVNAAPEQLRSWTNQPALRDTCDEGSVTKVNMLLARLPALKAGGISSRDAFTGSFHVDEGYEAMKQSYQCTADGHLPERPPFEVYCHTLTDASILSENVANAGMHTLTLFGLDMPYRLFQSDNQAAKQKCLSRYFDAMDRICSESFVDCLARTKTGELCVEIKSALDLELELGLDQGNIFHNAPSWFFTDDERLVGRWGVDTEDPRIYLCGSGALRGGAVSGVPGYCAAMQVMADLQSGNA